MLTVCPAAESQDLQWEKEYGRPSHSSRLLELPRATTTFFCSIVRIIGVFLLGHSKQWVSKAQLFEWQGLK